MVGREHVERLAQVAAIRVAVDEDRVDGRRVLDEVRHAFDALVEHRVRAHLDADEVVRRRAPGLLITRGLPRWPRRARAKRRAGGGEQRREVPDELPAVRGQLLVGPVRIVLHGCPAAQHRRLALPAPQPISGMRQTFRRVSAAAAVYAAWLGAAGISGQQATRRPPQTPHRHRCFGPGSI